MNKNKLMLMIIAAAFVWDFALAHTSWWMPEKPRKGYIPYIPATEYNYQKQRQYWKNYLHFFPKEWEKKEEELYYHDLLYRTRCLYVRASRSWPSCRSLKALSWPAPKSPMRVLRRWPSCKRLHWQPSQVRSFASGNVAGQILLDLL